MPTARIPIDAAHRAAASDAHPIGAVTGLTDALSDGRSEILSSVTVLSTDHAATWSADPAADTLIASASHGLTVNTPIAFGAGTGALPAGLSPEPEYYWVVAVPTTTTLQVSLTYGGAAVDITDAGTAGWVVRTLPRAVSNSGLLLSGLSLDTYDTIDLYYSFAFARVGSGSYIIAASNTGVAYFTNRSIGIGAPYVGLDGAQYAKKYQRIMLVAHLAKLANGLASVSFEQLGVVSDASNMASPTGTSVLSGGTVTFTSDFTSMRVYDGYSGYMLSGATAVAVRRP